MLENMYLKMPALIQSIFISIFSLKYIYRKKNKKIKLFASDSSILRDVHNKNLKILFSESEKSQYWLSKINQYNVDRLSDEPIEELKKLPIISKSDVNSRFDEINIKQPGTINIKTSGTSGSGLHMTTTKNAEAIMWSFFSRYRARFNIHDGDWCGYFCGRTIKDINDNLTNPWRKNYIGKQILFSNYHLSLGTISEYIGCLNKYQPPWIHGYPSFLTLLSELAKESGLKLKYKPKGVTLGSETVNENQKRSIAKLFNVTPTELYCQTEGVAMISECQHGNLHVDEEFSYVEFEEIDPNNNLYEIVGTNIYNRSFPLFRYRTGDIIEFTNRECHCGNLGRVVDSIDGRIEDSIVLPNGIKIGRLDHIFKSMTNIIEAQIFQNKDLSIIFRIVKSDFYTTEDEVKLKSEIDLRLSESALYEIVYVNKIERTMTGKLRFVVREK